MCETCALQLREKKDEAATRERFWDVTQSKIGQLTGTTAKELDDAAAHKAEANRTEAKFAGGRLDEGTRPHLPGVCVFQSRAHLFSTALRSYIVSR